MHTNEKHISFLKFETSNRELSDHEGDMDVGHIDLEGDMYVSHIGLNPIHSLGLVF